VTFWWLLPILGCSSATRPIGWRYGYLSSLRCRGNSARSSSTPVHPSQPEVADVYARIVSDEILTMANFGDELLNGPRADRTGR